MYSERYSYTHLTGEAYNEAEIAELLDAQHRRIVLYAQLGKFDSAPKPSFGSEFVSDRSLDEVVMEYLEKEENIEPVDIFVAPHPPFQGGQVASIQVEVREKESGVPIGDAKLKIKIVVSAAEPIEIDAGKTDAKGRAKISFSIPMLTSGEGLFLFHALSKKGLGEYKEIIHFEPQ